MCLRVCGSLYVCVCMDIQYVCVHAALYVYVCDCMSACVRVFNVCFCIRVWTSVCVCVFVCLYLCAYLCECLYVCICAWVFVCGIGEYSLTYGR